MRGWYREKTVRLLYNWCPAGALQTRLSGPSPLVGLDLLEDAEQAAGGREQGVRAGCGRATHLSTRLVQYMISPMPTTTMSTTWSSHSRSRVAPSIAFGTSLSGRGSSLYHAIARAAAHGSGEVKKLSKQRLSAADQAQMKRTSKSVCASLCDVRQSPSGRPKYSSCGGR
jgi:hypothetical protein